MSIQLSDNIRVGQQLPLESKYFNGTVPYTDVAQAESLITIGLRHQGLTVNIAGVEYWFKDGIANGDLVIKTGGSQPSALVALPFTTDHLATTNNEYVIGDIVWYAGNVYRCIANNDSLQPNLAPAYWTLLGTGFPLVQQPSNWNSTSGNNQILNKPTIPTVGTWGGLNYPTWTTGTPFVKMTAAGTFALDTTSYQPLITNPVTGTGTATRVAFWDTGSSISSDADLYWDNVNKRFGIGTTTPGYKLDLVNTDTTPFYVRFTNQDGINKNAITFGKSTSAAMAMFDSSGIVKILIGDGPTGFANFLTYNDNIFNFSYSPALGGATLPSSLVKFTPNFTYLTGTNFHTILDINPNINVSGGTNTLRGVYYNPNSTVGTVTTEIAFENTQGNNIFNTNSGSSYFKRDVTIDGDLYMTKFKRLYIERISTGLTTGLIIDGNHGFDGSGITQNILKILSDDGAAINPVNGTNVYNLLNLNPKYEELALTYNGALTTLRGYYYNPTVITPNVGLDKHIAFENTTGDIIHGNLGFPSGVDKMVTVDIDGKLKTAPVPSGGGGTVTSIATSGLISGGTITTSGTISTSMATGKLVGRYSASTGVMEEITVGSGLTLTGAGVLNNTATPTPLGYYGAFQDVTNQTAAVINTGYPMLLGVTDLTNGVTVVSGSRITIANTGIYNIQWSGQFTNPLSAEHDVTVWLRKNGVDVPGSAGVVLVPKKHGTFDGHTLPAWNYLIDPVAGDYYEFVWSTANTSVYLSFTGAGSPSPSAASVIVTVTQQSGIMAGTGISRGIYSVSTNTAAGSGANVDYVYLVSGTTTVTLPTAVGNTNRYTIKRSGTGVVSIATTSSQTIDGSSSPITITRQYVSIDLISNGTNWEII